MTSVLAERSAKLRGEQEPRIRHVPAHDGSIGWKALELAEMAGLTLDPWQERILETALNEQDGKWAAEEVALVCPRQNGKNEVLVARELAGLFLLGERMILHSAHQNDTSLEAFRRLVDVIEDKPTLVKRVSKVWRANGVEGIELRNGQRIRFATRRGGGRRGFTIDCLILDESMELPEAFYAALRPVVSAVENGQIWLTGSAVDQEVHEHGIVLARTRERGIAGDDPALFRPSAIGSTATRSGAKSARCRAAASTSSAGGSARGPARMVSMAWSSRRRNGASGRKRLHRSPVPSASRLI